MLKSLFANVDLTEVWPKICNANPLECKTDLTNILPKICNTNAILCKSRFKSSSGLKHRMLNPLCLKVNLTAL